MQTAIEINQNGFAGRNVALQTEPQAFECRGFTGHKIVGAASRLGSAVAERTNPKRIAKGEQTKPGDLYDTGVGAADPLVESFDSTEHGLGIGRDGLTGSL